MKIEPSQIDLTTLLAELDDRLPEAVAKVFLEVQGRLLKELPKGELPDGRARFVKSGTRERPLVPSRGQVILTIQKVHDRLSRKVDYLLSNFGPVARHPPLAEPLKRISRELRTVSNLGTRNYPEFMQGDPEEQLLQARRAREVLREFVKQVT